MADFKLLIVDDLAENLQAIAASLEGTGYDMAFALSGEEALEKCAATDFDLVMLDLMMPGIDGMEVLYRLRINPSTADIPVVIVSAKRELDINLQALELGAVDYLAKPFDKRELLLRVRNQLELRGTRKALEEANRVKDRFLSLLAHDLKAPLGLVFQQAAQGLKQTDVPEGGALHQRFEAIQKSAQGGLDLIQQLLDWGRLHQGNVPFRPRRFDLFEVAERVKRYLEDAAQNKGVCLENRIARGSGVWADPEMVEAILRNLIGNSLKYTEQGGQVFVCATSVGPNLMVEVLDQGCGIPPERLKQLFLPGGLNSTEGTEGERGSGLGLSLCQALAAQHHTRIQAESTPGEGSRFYFSLAQESA
ncbi:MAG: hybrid sensor histidine kinase/response regulator [bacterium]|nr:hybrid sensor histidine kinase/response regulator [bacterium]